ncbi:MAG: phosphonate ABC transporter ATP-binding protein [Sideroxydans sp.]|nr:phosphonate ABC transporter ATP-binding protein [Sideroxydans sp.]
MLRFDSVYKRFPDGTEAIRNISLHVPKGQFCVVLGPSGAGKSTLLRMLNGLSQPTEGSVHLAGEQITERSVQRLRKRVATVHQQFNLTPRMSVALNVLSGALPQVAHWRAAIGLFPPELRQKACRLLDEVGLTPEHVNRRVSELSGGQQQRVGIARAFMMDPAVLLADEPVASLDPRISRGILELLHRQSRNHDTTVLCSLHQPELAREFGDRIIAVNQGRLVFDGTPEQLTDQVCEDLYHGALAHKHDVPEVDEAECEPELELAAA